MSQLCNFLKSNTSIKDGGKWNETWWRRWEIFYFRPIKCIPGDNFSWISINKSLCQHYLQEAVNGIIQRKYCTWSKFLSSFLANHIMHGNDSFLEVLNYYKMHLHDPCLGLHRHMWEGK